MSINFADLAPVIWIVAAVLILIGVFIVIRFFWHHVLRYLVQAGVVILGVVLLLAVLRYLKVF